MFHSNRSRAFPGIVPPLRTRALWCALTLGLAISPLWAQTVERRLDASPGERLVLDLQTGASVSIRGGGSGEVVLSGDLEGRDADRQQLSFDRIPGGVRVRTEIRGDHRGNFDSQLKLELVVPPTFDVSIDSMGGGVSIEDVEGTFEGKTMGGALSLHRLRGRLDLQTMGGNIELTDSEVDGKVSTMGGRVLLRDVVGDVDGSSMGGNVRYERVTRSDGRSTGDAVIISTMGGRIDVAEAPSGAKLDTMGGDIHVRSASEYVDAKTMGGDIELDEVQGWVKAVTMGGNVRAVVLGGPARSDHDIVVTSMGGEIDLTLPAGVGYDFDVELAYTRNRSGRYRIESDFQLQQSESEDWVRGHGDPRKIIHATGSVNGGGQRVVVRTVNGDVHLRSN